MNRIFIALILAAISFLTACQKPTNACFTYSPASVSAASEVTFNAACSQNASIFEWNFGDGSADTIVNSSIITHQFITPGQFTVTLNASRKDGVTIGREHPTTTQLIMVE